MTGIRQKILIHCVNLQDLEVQTKIVTKRNMKTKYCSQWANFSISLVSTALLNARIVLYHNLFHLGKYLG